MPYRAVHLAALAILFTIPVWATSPTDGLSEMGTSRAGAAENDASPDGPLHSGHFQWTATGPILSPPDADDDHYDAIKDPSVVRYDRQWFLFCTLRGEKRSHQVEQIILDDLSPARVTKRRILTNHDGFFCAPQVFYFQPQERWYMICQASDPSWAPEYGAAFATTDNLHDPEAWSPLRPLGAKPAGDKAGLDFWIICDDTRAYLFFTTLDGHLWRESTSLDAFPFGWSEAELALKADIFEAAHIYKIQGRPAYLAVIEAQFGHGWRYFKAFLADRLDGQWRPLAGTKDRPMADMTNVAMESPRWTDSISHLEMIRAGHDQRLEIAPRDHGFVFQGVLDRDRRGLPYGRIPWRLGLATLEEQASPR